MDRSRMDIDVKCRDIHVDRSHGLQLKLSSNVQVSFLSFVQRFLCL